MEEENRCAKCHGDPNREGDVLLKSSPPGDLAGGTDSSYPGVGAHLIHLLASETHGEINCTECHIVPSATDTPLHADDDLPAEVVFGPLAQEVSSTPHYDPGRRSCSDTWCHGPLEVRWTRPRAEENRCGSCHGLPPEPPHPQLEDCSLCHAEVIDEEGKFIAPEMHVDGKVQTEPLGCSACHGSEISPAPPPDFEGNNAPSFPGVGAHTAHLFAEASRPVACGECHQLPPDDSPLSHVSGARAELSFSGVGIAHRSAPEWNPQEASCASTWCHALGAAPNSEAPIWTDSTDLGCDGCHGFPPPAPHPMVAQCELCHAEVVSADATVRNPALHIDGVVNVRVPEDCTSCHGNENPAPPRDLNGNSQPGSAGVGAHQSHVLGTDLSRAVLCEECHSVVTQVDETGHFDTFLPAEVTFSGVATAYDAQPTYSEGRCQDSYCHGAKFQESRLSGGALTAPNWTTVDGSQAACGTCHSLPPPLGHPQVQDCSSCHRNVRPDNLSFYQPELHVNGTAETVLPGVP